MLLLLATLLFWLLVIGGYMVAEKRFDVLIAGPLENETERDQKLRRDAEDKALQKDLKELQISRTIHHEEAGEATTQLSHLVELGVAENSSAFAADERGGKNKGEVWLCSWRPLWFALMQISFAWPLAEILGLFLIPPAAAGFALVLVTLPIALLSGRIVEENTRLGVKFLGRQTRGYLKPGPQFILPFFERGETIPFQAFVWGPHDVTESSNGFHMNGVSGPGNPAPGKFEVPLLGRWTVTIVLQITLRFRKSRKDAWWYALNHYSSLTEIGEQIAAAVSAILFNRARELGRTFRSREEEARQEGSGEDADDPRIIFQTITEFLNNIPEISGEVLTTLQRLGHDRLGGILPISVAVSSVIPIAELQQLLQKEDEAKVRRREEQLGGEAASLRSQNMIQFLANLSPDQRASFFHFNEQEVQRQFAAAPSGVDALVQSFLAGQVKKVTAPTVSASSPAEGSQKDQQ